ncbi:MAG: type II toxin-antitoxin system VapC family toxin [Bryobacteraceae bacterium]
MNGYLSDTNAFSELTKPTPSPEVEDFLRRSKDRVFVSVLSIGEVRKGIALTPSTNRRASLEDWLANEIMPWLGARVLPVTLEIAERWGDLAAELKVKGKPRPVVDALLAATAFRHDLIVATRNVADYDDLDVTVMNPWESI